MAHGKVISCERKWALRKNYTENPTKQVSQCLSSLALDVGGLEKKITHLFKWERWLKDPLYRLQHNWMLGIWYKYCQYISASDWDFKKGIQRSTLSRQSSQLSRISSSFCSTLAGASLPPDSTTYHQDERCKSGTPTKKILWWWNSNNFQHQKTSGNRTRISSLQIIQL